MELKRLLSLTRQAVKEYGMIEEGDRIAVGISGGKDSLTLLFALNELKRFYPKQFELEAITVDVGFDMDFSPVEDFIKALGVNYTIVKTDIKQIVFDEKKDVNPCSLCAKMRKGALNEKAKELNVNKVAYAHHKDDAVDTMMLSLMYEGRLQSLEPKTYWDKTGITLIRPLIYVKESEIIGFSNKQNLPVVTNNCPADGYTKREYVNNLLRELNIENPGLKDRMFTAIKDSMYERFRAPES